MRHINSRWHSHFSILFGIFLFLQLSASTACAASSKDGLIRVPIFFITDRNLQPSKLASIDFGPHRKYVNNCRHDPFMGSAYCVIENTGHKTITTQLQNLGWAKAEPTDKLGTVAAIPLTEENFEKVQKEFYEKVHAKALLCADKNVLLFSHGFNNSFVDGLHTAAKLAYYSERPLIVYSWPSVGKLRSYDTDQSNVEWSQDHYDNVLTHLEQLCQQDPSVKVRIFAHSMGTRLVVRATPILREKNYVVEVALICPDVDDGLVQHYIRRYVSPSGTAALRIYMSRHDKALAFSQLVHGGYTRLGEQADALSGWITKTLTAQNANPDALVKKDQEAKLLEELAINGKRMHTIDFTNIDKGFIGHNVPAQLICDMSFTDTPTPGLEFISEQSGLRSGLSNFFTKITKLKPASETALPGDVLYVVRTSDLAKSGTKSKRSPAGRSNPKLDPLKNSDPLKDSDHPKDPDSLKDPDHAKAPDPLKDPDHPKAPDSLKDPDPSKNPDPGA